MIFGSGWRPRTYRYYRNGKFIGGYGAETSTEDDGFDADRWFVPVFFGGLILCAILIIVIIATCRIIGATL